MAFNIIDSVNGLFGNEFIGKASSMFGESEAGLQRAMGGIIPSVLAGVLNKSASGDAGGILNMAKDAAGSGILGSLGSLGGLGVAGGSIAGSNSLLGKGADMLKGLFGDKTANVASTIANYSGVKESTAQSLMSLAAPAALGVIGKQAQDSNMGTSGLLSFLNDQKDHIMNAVPSGLNLAGALGLGSLGALGNKFSGAIANVTGAAKNVSGTLKQSIQYGNQDVPKRNWLWPLLLALAAIVLIWILIKTCNRSDTPTTMNTSATDTIASAPAMATPEMIKVTLPDGTVLDAYKGGIEDQLVNFLNDKSVEVSNDKWFDFDNLNFETGSATITPESNKQVQNIVAVLKAYPQVQIKIGGYTDKTGDQSVNMKLSQDRADATAAALQTAGANSSQLAGAQGYGSQFAKAAADAPDEDRKKDRRISVSVRKK